MRRASDGLQAIDEMEVDDVDLVLSDVRMPRLDGPSLARRLRRHGYAVPVVLMSAVDVEVDLPGVRFLPKPFDRDHLLHVIGSALGAYRSARCDRIALFPDPLVVTRCGHRAVRSGSPALWAVHPRP